MAGDTRVARGRSRDPNSVQSRFERLFPCRPGLACDDPLQISVGTAAACLRNVSVESNGCVLVDPNYEVRLPTRQRIRISRFAYLRCIADVEPGQNKIRTTCPSYGSRRVCVAPRHIVQPLCKSTFPTESKSKEFDLELELELDRPQLDLEPFTDGRFSDLPNLDVTPKTSKFVFSADSRPDCPIVVDMQVDSGRTRTRSSGQFQFQFLGTDSIPSEPKCWKTLSPLTDRTIREAAR